ncbi:MAG: glucose-1-phosphate adenylyltransferase [Saprospiraceae bacterium]|nr:glucose-1-phosphate adenylyltransferase [Saprospiraceae bacterium]MCF8251076.1 glucose-1-phosphate adenylyltransferase [Saprospiraceae bacterium]MCF8280361.1 glucose-1-phosphate adenylyltransferase [Bacteroidales bacterium]MCF8312868.1 glucose-1-phosphate adenylyltransferase [Saprospiraceae bacterium]MCF8441335.1 glucose-1-phosphate adenylyltransferase [Saprospiraceae bacterium]
MVIKMISLILGGGVGSRLFPLTEQRSKPAVPIGGKYRLIDIPISNCLNSGVRRMFVLTQFNSASLNQHIKNTYHFDHFAPGFVDILAAEQRRGSDKWFQGTADAVRQSMRHLINQDYDYILILSGDQLYQMDFEKMAREHVDKGADLTIATIPVVAKEATGFGIMKVNQAGMIESFVEKPNTEELPNWTSEVSDANKRAGKDYLASMGIYIFSKEALARLFEAHIDAVDFGKEIIPAAITDGYKVASYEYNGYWTDIGTISSFFEANIELTDDIPQFNLHDNRKMVYTRARMLPPSKFFGTVFRHVLVAEGCIIHAERIERSIIGIRSRVGNYSVLSHCILMGNDFFQQMEELVEQNVIPMGIGKHSIIEYAIIDKNVCIGDNVVIRGNPGKLADHETDTYVIVDGIVVVKKNAIIPSGSRIGA